MLRFLKYCPFLSTVIVAVVLLFIYGMLLTTGVVKAEDYVNLDPDPETVGVATGVQDIKARFRKLTEGTGDRDYSTDYLPTEYVPDEDIQKTFGVGESEDSGDAKPGDSGSGNSELDEADAAAAERRKERSDLMKNGEKDKIIRDARKTKLKENDQSFPGDSYDGFFSVKDSYFTGGDTVIIGDSREQGFGLFSGLDGIVNYAQKSYSVHQVFTKKWIDSDMGKLTLEEAMAANKGKFKKIYIMFGLNEMGWADEETFDNAYYQLIDMLKYYQSDAVIYVQSIINVTEAKSNESKNVFNNTNINARNEALKVVAEKEHVAYLDLNSAMADENGNLPADYASDGIHIKQKYMPVWVDFLKSHAVIREGGDESDIEDGSSYDPSDIEAGEEDDLSAEDGDISGDGTVSENGSVSDNGTSDNGTSDGGITDGGTSDGGTSDGGTSVSGTAGDGGTGSGDGASGASQGTTGDQVTSDPANGGTSTGSWETGSDLLYK